VIATAALGLVDRTGGFTIVQVADTLGVRPSSLYNHLSSKAEIVEAMPLVTAYTVSSPEVMGMYDELADTLSAAGVPDGQLLDVITMCDSVVIGAALDLAASDEVWAVGQARSPALIAAIRQAGCAGVPTGRSRSRSSC